MLHTFVFKMTSFWWRFSCKYQLFDQAPFEEIGAKLSRLCANMCLVNSGQIPMTSNLDLGVLYAFEFCINARTGLQCTVSEVLHSPYRWSTPKSAVLLCGHASLIPIGSVGCKPLYAQNDLKSFSTTYWIIRRMIIPCSPDHAKTRLIQFVWNVQFLIVLDLSSCVM